jgi:hypothetical protein
LRRGEERHRFEPDDPPAPPPPFQPCLDVLAAPLGRTSDHGASDIENPVQHDRTPPLVSPVLDHFHRGRHHGLVEQRVNVRLEPREIRHRTVYRSEELARAVGAERLGHASEDAQDVGMLVARGVPGKERGHEQATCDSWR